MALLAAMAGPLLSPSAATAQGLFGFLFGGGASYPQQQPPTNHPGLPVMTPGGKPYPFQSSPPSSRRSGGDEDRLSNYGSYRTICVRMCDGYYFPISTSTSRRGFASDEARSQASCGNEGQ
jgi:hypothetical protein